jgi:thymidylate synthase (FAD)
VSGISRVCSHQLVRSKFIDVLQRSQRYCNESQAELIVPDSIGKSEEISREYQVAIDYAFYTYEQLLKQGVKKEDARMILPACTTTEMVITGSFQAYKDLIKLRKNKESQWEIRGVVVEMEMLLNGIAPNIFGGMK